MSHPPDLNNSYGLEATPYQAMKQPGLEYNVPPQDPAGPPQGQMLEKGREAPEVVSTAGPKPASKRILGLKVALFSTVAAIIILLVLGVGIGVGVGVGMKTGSKSPPTSSPTSSSDGQHTPAPSSASAASTSDSKTSSMATSTTTAALAAVTSGTHGVAANSCQSTTPKSYHRSDGISFTEYCFTDWPNQSPAADGHGNVTDISRTIVYTFEACMDACVDYNKQSSNSGPKCLAVTYNSNLTNIFELGKQGGNCFLKDKKGIDLQGSAESACAAISF